MMRFIIAITCCLISFTVFPASNTSKNPDAVRAKARAIKHALNTVRRLSHANSSAKIVDQLMTKKITLGVCKSKCQPHFSKISNMLIEDCAGYLGDSSCNLKKPACCAKAKTVSACATYYVKNSNKKLVKSMYPLCRNLFSKKSGCTTLCQ